MCRGRGRTSARAGPPSSGAARHGASLTAHMEGSAVAATSWTSLQGVGSLSAKFRARLRPQLSCYLFPRHDLCVLTTDPQACAFLSLRLS